MSDSHPIFGDMESLLSSGGDPRIVLDANTGCNRYNVPACPTAFATFSSCTATPISREAWKRVQQARTQLVNEALKNCGLSEALDARMEGVRRELLEALQLSGQAQVVLAPSGTDCQLFTLFIAQGLTGAKLVSAVVGSDQTGSGTVHTSKGEHFSDGITCCGQHVKKGVLVQGFDGVESVFNVSLYCENGEQRQDTEELVAKCISDAKAKGLPVHLQLMDGSKLGWRAPSDAFVEKICSEFKDDLGKSLFIVVDACQCRLGRRRLRHLVDLGCFVVLTGSKFFSGPPFSGAVLIPEQFSERIDQIPSFPAGFVSGYAARSSWPVRFEKLRSNIFSAPSEPANLGCWLRWEAALHEIKSYFQVSSDVRTRVLRIFHTQAVAFISASRFCQVIERPPRGDAQRFIEMDEEFAAVTIIPFSVRNEQGVQLTAAQCSALHVALADSKTGDSWLIGQPVNLSPALTVLRICSDARFAVEVSKSIAGDATDADVVRALGPRFVALQKVLAKLEWIVSLNFSSTALGESRSLDPRGPLQWKALREQGHKMLDDMVDFVQDVRSVPVWTPMPQELRHRYLEEDIRCPEKPTPLADVHAEFLHSVLPHHPGNVHPSFFGWVQGGGTAVGMLAEMVASGLNGNCGGRDHIGTLLEKQVVKWMANAYGYDAQTASGLVVTGSSLANFIAVRCALTAAIGKEYRDTGLAGRRLCGYTSTQVHGCVSLAFDMLGLGRQALRKIPCVDYRMDLSALRAQIAKDVADGFTPFIVVGTCGTVDVGAVDDLEGISAVCKEHKLWFHVDGAFGGMLIFSSSPALRGLIQGISATNSIAVDFHKWGQVNYDAGLVLVRDSAKQIDAFAADLAYLSRDQKGMAAGFPWPIDLGPELSRSFRSLKVWYTLKTFGSQAIGAVVENCCSVAKHLEARIKKEEPKLRLLAPVTLNVVCFRYEALSASAAVDKEIDALNSRIVVELHERGLAVPSVTRIEGRVSVRCAIVNHRTTNADVDNLIDALLKIAKEFE